MHACGYCALSTALEMHSVRGTTLDGSGGHIPLAWLPLATSTVDARLRRRSLRKVYLDTASEAIIQEKVSAWIPHCVTRYSASYKPDMATKTVTLNGTQKRVSGYRERAMSFGSESLLKAL